MYVHAVFTRDECVLGGRQAASRDEVRTACRRGIGAAIRRNQSLLKTIHVSLSSPCGAEFRFLDMDVSVIVILIIL